MIKRSAKKPKKATTCILVTERQLKAAWDAHVVPRSKKIIQASKHSAALKAFIRQLRDMNEV